MKIIKEGRNQTGWAKEFACTGEGNQGGGCGAVLLVEFGDLFITSRSSIDETTNFVTFKCARCGVLTDLDRQNYPPDVDKIPAKRFHHSTRCESVTWPESEGHTSHSRGESR